MVYPWWPPPLLWLWASLSMAYHCWRWYWGVVRWQNCGCPLAWVSTLPCLLQRIWERTQQVASQFRNDWETCPWQIGRWKWDRGLRPTQFFQMGRGVSLPPRLMTSYTYHHHQHTTMAAFHWPHWHPSTRLVGILSPASLAPVRATPKSNSVDSMWAL